MTPAVEWHPSASHDALRLRARLLQATRCFFAERGVLEVETPILSSAAISDPHIESLRTRIAGCGEYFLNTSPEYPMKRLLAAGSGDIFQICKVFRDEEQGRWHNPEFTMIEWYRLGFDDAQLMDEVEALLQRLLPERRLERAERLTYADALRRHAAVDAHGDADDLLDRAIAAQGVGCDAALDRDTKLDLLMGLVVGPQLGRARPCFITDYPASQASLARLKPGTPPVAARFELYLDGVELANGFHELAHAGDQRARFERDLVLRRGRGQPTSALDERMLAALDAGLPECAGVAVGFDRIAALAFGADRLSRVLAFAIDRI